MSQILNPSAGGGGGGGNVVGPASSTDKALVRFSGTTGKIIQNGIAVETDTGQIQTENGSAAAPAYSFLNASNTGLYYDGDGNAVLSGDGDATVSVGFNVVLGGGTTNIEQGLLFTGIVTKSTSFTTSYDEILYLIDTVTAVAPITIQLVNSPITGQITIIKDSSGAANTFNITISGTTSGKTIDGSTTLVINVAYGVARLIYNGTQYNQI